MSTPPTRRAPTRTGRVPRRDGRMVARLAGLLGAVALTVVGIAPAAFAISSSATPTSPTSPSAAPTTGSTSGDGPTDVFVGVVDGVEVTRAASGSDATTYDIDVTVLSVYLGDIRTEEVAVEGTRAYARCLDRIGTMPPDSGMQYAFRVTEVGGSLQATSCADIRRAGAIERRALSAEYPDVRPPVAPVATFDDVAFAPQGLSAPVALTRAAAPGAALVLIGLLGLVVARRLGRPRT